MIITLLLIAIIFIFIQISVYNYAETLPEKQLDAAKKLGGSSYEPSINFSKIVSKGEIIHSIDEKNKLFSYHCKNSSSVQIGKISDIKSCLLYGYKGKHREVIYNVEKVIKNNELDAIVTGKSCEILLSIVFRDLSGREHLCEFYFYGTHEARKALEYYERINKLKAKY